MSRRSEEFQEKLSTLSSSRPDLAHILRGIIAKLEDDDDRLEVIESLDVAALDGRIASLEASNSALEERVATLEADVVSLSDRVSALEHPVLTRPAVGLAANIGGNTMSSVSVSVDLAGENFHLDWVDDKGDVTTDIPAGATLVSSSSDTAVATVGADVVDAAGSGANAPLSFLKAGATTLTGKGVDASGADMPGFTATVDLTLTPGKAAGLQGSVDGAPPVPVPVKALPLYTHATSSAFDPAVWPLASVKEPDGTLLYNFSGDTAGGPPTGASADWVVYTGPTA